MFMPNTAKKTASFSQQVEKGATMRFDLYENRPVAVDGLEMI